MCDEELSHLTIEHAVFSSFLLQFAVKLPMKFVYSFYVAKNHRDVVGAEHLGLPPRTVKVALKMKDTFLNTS